jgi:hypothetical protein
VRSRGPTVWISWHLFALLLAVRLDALQTPAVEAAREGVVLTRLPPLLNDGEIREQIGTGLTTSFVFDARALGTNPPARGGARVDVRYELWDEVYIVSRVDANGRAARTTFPSFRHLDEWWREARLAVLRPPAPGNARIEIRLRVIPFSQTEQLETQRWFSQALSGEASGSAGAVSGQSESLGQFLNLLIATSIGRPALLEYDWKLTLPAGKKR